MKFHLSISNFNKWVSPTFYLTIIFFILLSILSYFIMQNNAFRLVRNSRIGKDVRYAKYELSKRNNKKIIWFIGASKLLSAINTEQLNKNNSKYKFVSLSMNSMAPWEYYQVLRNIDLNRNNTALVVLAFMPSAFNQNSLHPIFHTKAAWKSGLDHFSGFSELTCIDGLQNKFNFFKSIVYGREDIVQWTSIVRSIFTQKIPSPYQYNHSNEFEKNLRVAHNFKAEVISNYHLANYKFTNQFTNLQLIFNYLDNKKINYALLHLPCRKDYYKPLYNNPKEYQKYKNIFKHAKNKLYWETVEDFNTSCNKSLGKKLYNYSDDDLLLDYGHFSKSGSEIFCKHIDKLIDPFIQQ